MNPAKSSRCRWIGVAICVSALASGCASGKKKLYLANVGGHFASYTESYSSGLDSLLSSATGKTITTTSGDNSKLQSAGYGFQVGFTEQLEHFSGDVTFFYVRYNPLEYSFNVQGEGSLTQLMKPSAFGLAGSLGVDIWWLRPQIYYKLSRFTIDSEVSSGTAQQLDMSSSGLSYMIGGGLALRIPLGARYRLTGQGNYIFPLRTVSGVSVNEIVLHLGFEIPAFEMKGK